MTRVIPVDEAVATLRARADELDAQAAEHRKGHARRESVTVRRKYAAQARELRRMADVIASYDELSPACGPSTSVGLGTPALAGPGERSPAHPPTDADHLPFQARVWPWMLACFGEAISQDTTERTHRFVEEALELAQACGCSASESHQLVDYVYGRPVGQRGQEVGGVMVTLAALCRPFGLDMHDCGDAELARVWTKVEQTRAKHAAKPKHSPLPGPAAPDPRVPSNTGSPPGLPVLHPPEDPPEVAIRRAREDG